VLFGVSTPSGPNDLTQLDAFEAAAGKRVAIYSSYQSWQYLGFDPDEMSAVAARGAIPMVTWEPWDHLKGGVHQPGYSLKAIADGSIDAYITTWAREAKAWGGRIFLRFAHEMNGTWYPWCEGVNGNAPASYVRAWRHVHDIFTAVAATNVRWVWSPIAAFSGSTPFRELYPGDAHVDWVAVDGYNGGVALDWGGWRNFHRIFDASLRRLRELAPDKPIMIAEVASAEQGGSKARWITNFFASLAARPEITAFVWFNWHKETDWRIQSSPASQDAFAAGVADPRYGR
jgi:beta-mannanase